MSQIEYNMKKCPICGKESEHMEVISWFGRFGPIPETIDECPYCRYITYDFYYAKPKKNIKEILKSTKYIRYIEQPEEYYDNANVLRDVEDITSCDPEIYTYEVIPYYRGEEICLFTKQYIKNHSLPYIEALRRIAAINQWLRFLMVNDLTKKEKKYINKKINKQIKRYKELLKELIYTIRKRAYVIKDDKDNKDDKDDNSISNLRLRTYINSIIYGGTRSLADKDEQYQIKFLRNHLFMKPDELEKLKQATSHEIYIKMLKYYKKIILSQCEVKIGGYKLKNIKK